MQFNFFSYFIVAASVVFIALVGWFIVQIKKENSAKKFVDFTEKK